MHIASALTYTMLVLLAAFVARGRARGAQGVTRALLAGGLMLAPQPTGPTQVLLGSPDHVGTGVPVLLLLLLLDWAAGSEARRRWYVPVAAGLLLAWSIVGDPLVEVVGAAPLFLACVIRAYRLTGQRWRASFAPVPVASPDPLAWLSRAWSVARAAAGYELALAAAAVVAVPAASAANRVLIALGGFRTAEAWYGLLTPRQMVHGLPLAARSVLALFGADPWGVHGGGNIAFALVHLIGVAVALAAFLLGAWRLARPGGRPGDLVADVIVIAIAANVAAFLVEVPKPNVYAAHEIGPVLALGAALAGRLLGGSIADGWRRARGVGGRGVGGRRAVPFAAGWRRALPPALAIVLAVYAGLLSYSASHQQAPPRNVALTTWLLQHHLHRGLAPYWEAASITLDSGGAISLLSVTPGKHGYLVPQKWQTDVRLADAPGGASFVITSPAENVHRKAVLDTFGSPAHTYYVGHYTVYVWQRNLLPRLARTAGGQPPGRGGLAG